jgi:hypothetical protein
LSLLFFDPSQCPAFSGGSPVFAGAKRRSRIRALRRKRIYLDYALTNAVLLRVGRNRVAGAVWLASDRLRRAYPGASDRTVITNGSRAIILLKGKCFPEDGVPRQTKQPEARPRDLRWKTKPAEDGSNAARRALTPRAAALTVDKREPIL